MYWMPTKLFRVLMFWISLTTLVFWLPLIRGAFDGDNYHWALAPGISGTGIHGSYWVPVLGSAFALTTIFLGCRGARFPFHWLLITWHLFLGIGSVYLAITNSESFVFSGDTLGISFSLTWIAPLICGGFALMVLYWVQRDLSSKVSVDIPPWTRSNTMWLLALVGLLPLQFVLFRFGEPNSLEDQIGVIITISQWMFFSDAIGLKFKSASIEVL